MTDERCNHIASISSQIALDLDQDTTATLATAAVASPARQIVAAERVRLFNVSYDPVGMDRVFIQAR